MKVFLADKEFINDNLELANYGMELYHSKVMQYSI